MTGTRSPRPAPAAKASFRPGRRFGVAVLAALTFLFCSGSTAPTGCKSSSDSIGPSGAQVAGAAIGVGAIVAVAIIVPVEIHHHHHTLKGCVFNGPAGLQLRTSDAKTYTLEGGPSSIKVGDLVQFHGSRVKKARDVNGDQVFRVAQLKKDFGPCDLAVKGATQTASK